MGRKTVVALMDAVVVIRAPQWHWDTHWCSFRFPLGAGFSFLFQRMGTDGSLMKKKERRGRESDQDSEPTSSSAFIYPTISSSAFYLVQYNSAFSLYFMGSARVGHIRSNDYYFKINLNSFLTP